MNLKILIVEDDMAFLAMLSTFLERHNFSVSGVTSISDAQAALQKEDIQLVISDLKLPDGSGITLLEELKKSHPEVSVIMMTGYAEVTSAVAAIKKGALDYISKPFRPEELLMIINQGVNGTVETRRETQSAQVKSSKRPSQSLGFVGGIGPVSKKFNQYLQLVGPTDMSVLIQGESGTGKEVAARMIHQLSQRKDQPFVAVDCGVIPKEIAASEFFGHIKGSFTGAVADKKGHFEEAQGGTLFLDEVGNLTYENQIQLLRALQERKVKPVGGSHEIAVDVRIISATNEQLLNAVTEGNFREDLYHRLNEFFVEIPSLAQRKEDLFLFTEFFLDQANDALQKNVLGLSLEVEAAFKKYHWPGNLRELKNVIKRAVLLTDGSQIRLEAIPKEVLLSSSTVNEQKDFSKATYEKQLIIDALEEAGYNKTKAARLLNITRKTLYNKLTQYDLKL